MSELREYLIKITADISGAEQKLKSLAKTAEGIDKVKLNLNMEKGFSDEIAKITGSLGKVTQVISELKNEFSAADFKSFGTDIKQLSSDLSNSVNNIQSTFEKLQGTLDVFNTDGSKGLGKVFEDFSDQIKNLMETYSGAAKVIENLGAGDLKVKDIKNGMADSVNASTKQTKRALALQEEELAAATERINKILERFDKQRQRIIAASEGMLFNAKENGKDVKRKASSEAIQTYKEIVDSLLSEISKNKRFFNIDLNDLVFSKINISEDDLLNMQQKLEEEYNEAVKRLKSKRNPADLKGAQPTENTFTVNVDVKMAEIDESGIQAMVDDITKNIRDQIQLKLAKNPLKLPLAFATALSDEQLAQKSEADILRDFEGTKTEGETGLIKSLQLQVQADKDELIKKINSTVKEINEAFQNNTLDPIKIRAEVDMDEKSAQNAAYDITNALEDRNKQLGRDGVPIGQTTFNIGDIGGLATEGTLQNILEAVSNISIDGVKIGGIANKAAHVFTEKEQTEKTDNTDIVYNGFKNRLMYGNRSYMANKDRENQDNTTTMLLSQKRQAEQRGIAISDLKKTISSDKKGIEDLRQLQIYTESEKDDKGIRRALYGQGETIEEWQEKLENYFKTYKQRLGRLLDSPTEYDEAGNIVTEGIRTRYKRIKNSEQDIEFRGKLMKEWQKTIIEANEKSRETELKEGSKARAELSKSEQVKVLKELEGIQTDDEAITRIINEKWNKRNEAVLASPIMSKEFSKQFGKIQSAEVTREKERLLRNDTFFRGQNSQPYAFQNSINHEIALNEKRIQAQRESLALNNVATDKETGKVLAKASTAIIKEQEAGELTQILEGIAAEQFPKLSEAQNVANAAKQNLDNINEFIKLYNKQSDKDNFTSDDSLRLQELQKVLSSDAIRGIASGKEKETFDEAFATITQLIKKQEENKGKLSETDQRALMDAQKAYNNTRDASLEEVFKYATAHQPAAQEEVRAAQKKVFQVQQISKRAARSLAENNEWLRPVVEGGEKGKRGYAARQKEIDEMQEEYNSLMNMVGVRSAEYVGFSTNIRDRVTGNLDYSSLTDPQNKRQKFLKSRLKALKAQQRMYREIHKGEEESMPDSTIEDNPIITNLKLQEETAKAYTALSTSSKKVSEMSSEELTSGIDTLTKAIGEWDTFLSSASKDASTTAKMMVAYDIDELRKQEKELTHQYDKGKSEGMPGHELRRIEQQRDDVRLSIEQLTGENEHDQQLTRQIAELTFKRRLNNELISEIQEGNGSQVDLDKLTSENKNIHNQIKALRKKSGKTALALNYDIEQEVAKIATENTKWIEEMFGVESFDTTKIQREAINAAKEYQSRMENDSSKVAGSTIREAREKVYEQKIKDDRANIVASKEEAIQKRQELESALEARKAAEAAEEEARKAEEERTRIAQERQKKLAKMSSKKRLETIEGVYDAKISELNDSKQKLLDEQEKVASRVVDSKEISETQSRLSDVNQKIEAAKKSIEVSTTKVKSLDEIYAEDESIKQLLLQQQEWQDKRKEYAQQLSGSKSQLGQAQKELQANLNAQDMLKDGKRKRENARYDKVKAAEPGIRAKVTANEADIQKYTTLSDDALSNISEIGAEIGKRKTEILQNILQKYEQDIEAEQKELIDAVNRGESEDKIQDIRQRLLTHFDEYQQYGGKKSFSSSKTLSKRLRDVDKLVNKQAEDIERVINSKGRSGAKYFDENPDKREFYDRANAPIVERTGYIGNQPAIEWARNYTTDALQLLYDERDSLSRKLTQQKADVIKSDSAADQIADDITEKIRQTDEELARIQAQKAETMFNQYLKEADSTKSKSIAKKYVNKAFDIWDQMLQEEGALEVAKDRRNKLSEELERWKAKPESTSRTQALDNINTQVSYLDNLIKTIENANEHREKYLQRVDKKFSKEVDSILQEPELEAKNTPNIDQAKITAERAAYVKAREKAQEKEFHEEIQKEEKDKFKTPKELPWWRSWRYANMTEDEAILSKQVEILQKKAFKGVATDGDRSLLDSLKEQASNMGLMFSDKGFVIPKVSYKDFMAHPNDYTIPTITTEKAQAAGLSTKGTISGTIQSVSITEPVNVGTVGTVSQVASVNLGTIEGLLSAIASKIGADTSGIKMSGSEQSKSTSTASTNTKNRKNELNKILRNPNATKEEKDAALLEGLQTWGLNKNGDNLYFANKGGKNYNPKVTIDELKRLAMENPDDEDVNAKIAEIIQALTEQIQRTAERINKVEQEVDGTEKSENSQSKKTSKSQETKASQETKKSRTLSKNEVTKLRQQYNKALTQAERDEIVKQVIKGGYGLNKKEDGKYSFAKDGTIKDFQQYLSERTAMQEDPLKILLEQAKKEFYATSDEKERLEIAKKYVAQGLLVGKNKNNKLYFSASANNEDAAEYTKQFIADNGIKVEVKVKTDPEKSKEEPKSSNKNPKEEPKSSEKKTTPPTSSHPDSNPEEPRAAKQKIAGFKDRNGKVYTAEDFAAQEGLAEQVLISGKLQATKDTEAGRFWKESIANANAYIEAASKAETVTDDVAAAEGQSAPDENIYKRLRHDKDYLLKYHTLDKSFGWEKDLNFAESSADDIRVQLKEQILNWYEEIETGLQDVIISGDDLSKSDNIQNLLAQKLGFTYEKVKIPQEGDRKAYGYKLRPIDISALPQFEDIYKTLGGLNSSEAIGKFISESVYSSIVDQVKDYWQNTYDTAKTNAAQSKDKGVKAINNSLMQKAIDRMGSLGFNLQDGIFVKSQQEQFAQIPIPDVSQIENAEQLIQEYTRILEENNRVWQEINSGKNTDPAFMSYGEKLNQALIEIDEKLIHKGYINGENGYAKMEDPFHQLGENTSEELNHVEQEANEATEAVIRLDHALEDMKSILSSSGKEGLSSALSALTKDQLKGILADEKNGLDASKISKLNKSGLIDRIIGGVENPISSGSGIKDYNKNVKYGLDRVRKAQILSESGVHPTRDLLLTNKEIWDDLKQNGFLRPNLDGLSDEQTQKALNDWGDQLSAKIDEHTARAIQQAGFKDSFAFTDQLEGIEKAKHENWEHSSNNMGWTFFNTKGYKNVPKEEPLDYKIYASLENVADLNKDTVEGLFKALSDAGYVGGLKTARLSDSAGQTDQIVLHGRNARDQEIAYRVLQEFSKQSGIKLGYLGGGFDTRQNGQQIKFGDEVFSTDKGRSFSSMLENGLYEYMARFFNIRSSKPNETPVSTESPQPQPEAPTPSEAPEHKENADAMRDEAEAAREDKQAKDALNDSSQQGPASSEPEQHRQNADAMSAEAKEAERLAEVKRKAQELAASFDDPDKLQKEITKKEGRLGTLKKPETIERYNAELEAMRERLKVIAPPNTEEDKSIKPEDTTAAEKAKQAHTEAADAANEHAEAAARANQVEKEGAAAAQDVSQAAQAQASADAQRDLNEARTEAGNIPPQTNSDQLRAEAEAAREDAAAHEELKKQKEEASADIPSGYSWRNADEARAVLQRLKPDVQFGNAPDFRAVQNGFNWSDEAGNNYVYRVSKKAGEVLREGSEVSRVLTDLTKLQNRIDELNKKSSVENFRNLMPEMFQTDKADEIRKIQARFNELTSKTYIDPDTGLAPKGIANQIKADRAELEQLYDAMNQYRRQRVGEGIDVGESTGGLVTAKADLEAYFNSLNNSSAAIQRFNNSNTEMTYTLKNADNMVETHTVSINEYGRIIDTLSQSQQYVSPLQQAITGLGSKFRELFRYFAASASIYRVFNTFKQGVNVVKQLDSALVEMRKVSNESLASLKNYQLESFDIADRVGTTAQQIQQSTADWMRLGESLDVAKKSAEYSTLLLNVSEFQNIDAATESLVSMSQAYKELDKIDIIDKLNNIGNNFSISTSDLAQSLQKSAGALTTAHNSIDEAIALTVAANQVIQAPDIVGQSLKTISLRLTGTTIEDMQEAGEEIDGLIETQSKLRKTIQDITKVSSNGYQGFDILDENGNYKTTYEMLSGIAEVWHEIAEEDKRMGTNRQSLLLETIAGKTRAAAASSILENFDTLKEVYESSLNSEGSAQAELDKYLDSVEGKLAQLQNRFQELASVTIESQWLKDLIDMGSGALEIFTALLKQFGSLNVIVGALGGFSLQKYGLGMLATSKGSGWSSLISSLFNKEPSKQVVFEKVARPLSQTMQDAFSKMDMDGDFFTQMDVLGFSDQDILDLHDTGLNSLINDLGGIKEGAISAGDAMQRLGVQTVPVLKEVDSKSSVFTKLGSGLKSVVSATLTSIAVGLAFAAVTKAFSLFWENVVKAEENAIKRGEEAKEKIQDIKDDLSGKQKFQDNSANRLATLYQGVDSETGKNVSLSGEEYKEYLNLANQAAEIYPSVVKSYDSQGNAILNLSNNIQQVTDSLNEFLNVDKIVAGMEIGKNLDNVMEAGLIKINDLKEDIAEAKIDLDDYNNATISYENGFSLDTLLKDGIDYDTEAEAKNIKEALIGSGITNFVVDELNNVRGKDGGGHISIPLMLNPELSDESAEQTINDFNARLEQSGIISGGKNKQEAAKTQASIVAYQSQIDAIWNEIVPNITDSFMQNPNYNLLSDELKQGITSVISSIDPSTIEKPSDQTWEEFFETTYLNPILTGIDKAGNIAQVNKTFADLLKKDFATGKTTDELKDSVNKELETLFAGDEYEQLRRTIRIALDYTYIDSETGEEIWKTDDLNKQLFDRFGIDGKNQKGNIGEEFIQNSLTVTEKEDLLEGLDLGKINIDPYKVSTDQLIDAIHRYQEEIKKVAEGETNSTLADIFNDESYSQAAEKYEKNLSSLTGALESFRSEGKLSNEAMRDLREEFPEIGDITEENITTKAYEELDGWIDTIRKKMSELDMTPEGIENANAYIQDLILSYEDLDLSIGKARSQFVDNAIAKGADPRRSDLGDEFDANLEELHKRFGEDLNADVIYTLVATDQFSGTADEIAAKYEGMEITWRINIENKEAQRNIDLLQSKRSTAQAKRSARQASGQAMTLQDYSEDNLFSQQLIGWYNEQLETAQLELDNATTPEAKAVAQTAMNSIMQNIYSEEENIANNRNAMRELPLKPYERAIEVSNQEIERINQERERKQANGETIFTDENNREIAELEDQNKQLKAQETILTAQKKGFEILAKAAGESLEGNEQYESIQDKIYEVSKQRADNAQRIAELDKENADEEMTRLNNQREVTSLRTSAAKRAIEDAQNDGKEVGESLYQDAIKASEDDMEILEKQKDKLEKEIANFEKGKTPDEIAELANDTEYTGLLTQLDQVDAEIINIGNDIENWQDAINNIDATHLKNELEIDSIDSQNAQLEIKKLQDAGKEVTRINYGGAITTAESEKEDLKAYRTEIRNQLNKMESDYNHNLSDLAADETYRSLRQELYSTDSQIADIDANIRGWQDAVDSISLNHLKNEFTSLDREENNLRRKLEDPKGLTDDERGETYLELMENNEKQQDNIRKRINARQRQFNVDRRENGWTENDDGWQQYLEDMASLREEMANTKAEQEDLWQSFQNIPVESAMKSLDKYKNRLQEFQEELQLDETKGIEKTEQDYNREIGINRNIVTSATNVENAASLLDAGLEALGYKEDSEYRTKVKEWGSSARSDRLNAEGNIFTSRKAKDELRLNEIQKRIDIYSNAAEDLQNAISLNEAKGLTASETAYEGLIKNADNQIRFYEDLKSEYEILATKYKGTTYWADYVEGMQNAENQINSLKTSQIEWQNTIDQMPLTNLQNIFTDLQARQTELQDSITFRESRGLNKTVKQYEDLLDNSKEQVKNIREQNVLLRRQQMQIRDNNGVLDTTSDKYRELQSQIDSNNSTLRSLIESQREYQLEAGTIATQNIIDTIGQLKNALSEGGLSSETLNNLIKDMPNAADMLFHTTTGQYVDTQSMQAAIKQQGEFAIAVADTEQSLQRAKYAENAKRIEELSAQYGIAAGDADALNQKIQQFPYSSGLQELFDLTEENQNIGDTILNLQTLKEELYQTQSALGRYQLAQSTWNPSDNMQAIRNGMEGAKKLWEDGWLGKDDFTTYADLIAKNDEIGTDAAILNFEKNAEDVEKYLTENADGVHRWVNDIRALGDAYIKTNAAGEEFLDIDDMQKFSDAMGRSKEFSEYMLMAMQDAGYNVDLSIIGDEFANSFDEVNYHANNAGQQVKGLIEEMGNLANQGIPVAGSAEKAADALKLLSESGVDVTDLIEQVNEIGNLNGFKIDPKTFKISFTQGISQGINESVEEVNNTPVKLSPKYDISDTEIRNAKYALQKKFRFNSEDIAQAVEDSGIKKYNLSDLLQINHHDKALSEGEKELESFATSLGLSWDQCNALLGALTELGLIDIDPEVETTSVEEAKESVEELREEAENPIMVRLKQAKDFASGVFGKISEKIKLEANESKQIKEQTAPVVEAITTASGEIVSAITGQEPEPAGSGNTGVTPESSSNNGASEHRNNPFNSSNYPRNNEKNNPVVPNIQQGAENVVGNGGIIQQMVQYTAEDSQIQEKNEEIEGENLKQEVDITYNEKNPFRATTEEKVVNVKTESDGGDATPGDTTSTHYFEGDESGLKEESEEAKKDVDNVPGKKNVVFQGIDQASSVANRVKNAISGITGKAVEIVAKTTGLDRLQSVKNLIDNIRSKTVNVVTNVFKNIGGAIKGALGSPARGTAHVYSSSSSYASGTAYDMWTDYRHSKNAWANGTPRDWELPQDEEALVNEFAPQHPESIVRDGKWMIIPGGPHVEQLKKGDIIFNAGQTEDLLRRGKTFTPGRVAHANGTAYNMINAHSGPRNSKAKSGALNNAIVNQSKKNTGYSGSTGSTASNTKAVNNNTKSTNSNTKSTKKNTGSLDAFKQWLEKFVDWIEVRINRVSESIDNLSQISENLAGYAKKNAEVNKAMSLTGLGSEKYTLKTSKDGDGVQRVSGITYSGSQKGTQIDNNLRGAERYFKFAEEIRTQAIKNGLVNATQAADIVGKIQSGAIDIKSYEEKQREFISSYQEW